MYLSCCNKELKGSSFEPIAPPINFIDSSLSTKTVTDSFILYYSAIKHKK